MNVGNAETAIIRAGSFPIQLTDWIVWQKEPAMRWCGVGPGEPVEQGSRGVRIFSLLYRGSDPVGRKRNRRTWSHVMDDWDSQG
jgi:hypothetical protein